MAKAGTGQSESTKKGESDTSQFKRDDRDLTFESLNTPTCLTVQSSQSQTM